MYFIQLHLIFNILLTGMALFYYLSRIKEINANYLKYIILIGIVALFIDFFINFTRYVPAELPSEVGNTLMIFTAQLLLFSTVAIFIVSVNYSHEDIIDLKYPSKFKARKGRVHIGKVMSQNAKKHKFFLSLDDLEKHMFVCGSTGMGKSNFIQNLLINFKNKYEIPFLLIEFKAEYLFLQNLIENVVIFRPGENFSINIFDPEGAHPEIHAERIFDILKSGQFLDESSEYSPQMQKVLIDILTEICKNKDLQNWEGFYKQCATYLKKERNRIPMLAQTLISIRNRVRRFSIGPLKAIFGSKTQFKVKELFRRNVIIDLSSIIRLGGEKEDALFFLNMILKYLWDENLTKGGKDYKGIKHITIVEDAQYFVPQDLTKQTKLSTYLEDIALLQRGTGECLISIATRPQVSEEILANCGVLVIFKNHMEKEFQCKLLNLNEMDEHYLSILEKGRCIIRVNSVKRPFLLTNPYIPRKWLSNIEIERNNEQVFNKNGFNIESSYNFIEEAYSIERDNDNSSRKNNEGQEITVQNKEPEDQIDDDISVENDSNFNIQEDLILFNNEEDQMPEEYPLLEKEASDLEEFEDFISKMILKEKKEIN
ncbi:MAG: AAA-like domain protein [Promethearchaeota archaeon]|nr:MAG: AAA-like domain protein [Candidatus Lokiarchaeota archaeon]